MRQFMKQTIGPASPRQEDFLLSDADITVFGGAAGSGKSFVALMTPLRFVDDPFFRGVIFRRTMPEITAGGGLWDTAQQMYKDFDKRVKFREKDKEAIFPSGARIKFSHLEMEKDKYSHQGAQYSFVLFDEGTHFSETMIDYLRSRLRAPKSRYKTQMKITCNPDYDSFLRKWVQWYLDPISGIPDPAKAGIMRYFVRSGEELQWADTREELEEVHGVGPESGIISFVFHPATIYDNPPLMEADPSYISRLKSLTRVEKERLLYGSWYARPEDSGYWEKGWVEFISKRPLKVKKRVRSWDLSGSIPSESYPNPDWTVGVLMSLDLDNNYVIEDVCRFRDRFQGVFKEIVRCAKEDGTDTQIIIPADPGAAGKAYAQQLVRDLADLGFYCKIKTTNQNKLTRFAPFASVSEAGFVKIVTGEWNDTYTDELESFDGARNKKDDQVDASSDGYWSLTQSITLPDFKLPNFTQSNPFTLNYN
jgi:predicted phage terminase large subunit-like protein